MMAIAYLTIPLIHIMLFLKNPIQILISASVEKGILQSIALFIHYE